METNHLEQNRELNRTRIFLQPIAAPSILGMFAFAAAMFVVSINLAGWYGGKNSEMYVIPFVAAFGGLAQLLAGMWAFRARDALATAFHGMWGSFWMGYGLLYFFFTTGILPATTHQFFIPLGYWFVTLAVITGTLAIAATAENVAMGITLALLALGSGIGAVGFFSGLGSVLSAAGWVLLFSSLGALYTAAGLLFQSVFGYSVLPLGHRAVAPVESGAGEPAVIHGQ